MDRALDRLAKIVERVLAGAFVFAVCLNFVNVVQRYVFNATIEGADEIQIYIMIWVTFLGAALVTWRRQHLRMDVFLHMLPGSVRTGLKAVELVLLIGLCAFLAYHSFDYASRMYAIGRTSDTAGIPLWTVHAAIPIGLGLIAAISAWRLMRFRRAAETTDEPHAGTLQ